MGERKPQSRGGGPADSASPARQAGGSGPPAQDSAGQRVEESPQQHPRPRLQSVSRQTTGWSDCASSEAPANHRDAKAQAKAAKAYAKAQRPWYKKKRVLIPLALLLLIVFAVATSGGGSDSTDPTASGSSSPAASGESPEAESAPFTPRFAGQTEDDVVGDAGTELVRDDVRLTATQLQPASNAIFNGVCSNVTIVNGKEEQIDFNLFDFKLQDPAGAIRNVGIFGENDLSSGSSPPAGRSVGTSASRAVRTPGSTS